MQVGVSERVGAGCASERVCEWVWWREGGSNEGRGGRGEVQEGQEAC